MKYFLTLQLVLMGMLGLFSMPIAVHAATNADDGVSVHFGEDNSSATQDEKTAQLASRSEGIVRNFITALGNREAGIRTNEHLSEGAKTLLTNTISQMRSSLESQLTQLDKAQNEETVRGINTQIIQLVDTRKTQWQQQRVNVQTTLTHAQQSVNIRGDRIVEIFRTASKRLETAGRDVSALNTSIDALDTTLNSLSSSEVNRAEVLTTAKAQINDIRNQVQQLQ